MHIQRVGNGAPDFELPADASARLLPTLPLLSLKPRPLEGGAFSRPNMAPNWRRRGAVFSESQIDDFVMPITSAEAVVWPSSPPFLVTGLVQGGLSWEII
jgi:hypothetical protein